MNTLKWIADRAKERSSWLGLITIITAAGVSLNPDVKEAIISLGVAIGGLVAVVTKDK